MDLDNVQVDLLDPWDDILANVAWAVRSLYHTTLGATPGELVFGRDMLFNIRNKIDWQSIHARRQRRTDNDRARENASRKDFDYAVGDKVLLKADHQEKLRAVQRVNCGPYLITRVHTNGTVTIARGAVSEQINVRRVSPSFEKDNC